MLFKRSYNTEELIQGCVANSRRHQEVLYKMYFEPMYQMCRRLLTSDEDALSALNSGFLKVFQKIHTYEHKGSLEGWIRRIIYHCVIELIRRERKYKDHIRLELSNGLSHSATTDHTFLLDELTTLLDKVPQASRKVFKLFVLEGYSHKEIGDLMGIHENTSKWHLSNARSILKREYEKNESMVKSNTN